jgi:hypothetical protein
MEVITKELETVIDEYASQLKNVTEKNYAAKPLPHKWSKKELLGHLIDSAQSNIRRFVVAQYEDKPYIVYAQDTWVKAADYQHYPTNDLIALWALLNKHMCIVLKNIPAGLEERLCMTGELHSIKWLAEDYIKHLKHHLHQILDLEPVPYP